jgi:outer membrane protein OmpA-like peptidoglycan-associated protein
MEANQPFLFGLLILTFVGTINGQDLKGSKDHPLVTRYPDTQIIEYRSIDYDEFPIRTAMSYRENGKFIHPAKKFGGKLTIIQYQSKSSAPFLQVLRNFSAGLKSAGFHELFSCDGQKTCGPLFVTQSILGMPVHNNLKNYPSSTDSSNGRRYGYWSGVLPRKEGDVAVGVLVGEDGRHPEKVDIILDIIESKPMDDGLVAVNPQFLADEIAKNGKVILDGVLFDTDQATIKSESATSLKAIADYLAQNKSVNIFIVGHTDTIGNYAHNIDLSNRRAVAVAAVLVKDFKIDRNRLQSVGIGPVAPIGSNASEDGRAKNRRVEMVLRQ